MRHTIDLPTELERKIEDWRAKQRPIPTLKDAVRHLLRKGLGEKA